MSNEKKTEYNNSLADKFFSSFPKNKVVSYKEYWKSVQPQNTSDIFRRYLFAYCSVHTTWKGNCSGYQAIKNFDEWIDNKETLREKLANSGVGLHNNRTEYIWEFKDKFFSNPNEFILTTKKYHIKKRNQIVENIRGLGHAKVSFALEMIHPNFARTTCMDVHMLRLYGMENLTYKSKAGFAKYRKAEQHWNINCGKIGISSYIARCIYWDGVQRQDDSRYWSYVLEE